MNSIKLTGPHLLGTELEWISDGTKLEIESPVYEGSYQYNNLTLTINNSCCSIKAIEPLTTRKDFIDAVCENAIKNPGSSLFMDILAYVESCKSAPISKLVENQQKLLAELSKYPEFKKTMEEAEVRQQKSRIENSTISYINLKQVEFLNFYVSVFDNCSFEGFDNCIFNNCVFIKPSWYKFANLTKCRFINCIFDTCSFEGVSIDVVADSCRYKNTEIPKNWMNLGETD